MTRCGYCDGCRWGDPCVSERGTLPDLGNSAGGFGLTTPPSSPPVRHLRVVPSSGTDDAPEPVELAPIATVPLGSPESTRTRTGYSRVDDATGMRLLIRRMRHALDHPKENEYPETDE